MGRPPANSIGTHRPITPGSSRLGLLLWLARVTVLAIGLLSTSACGHDDPNVSSRPNIVVFLIDTLRADYLSCYGHPEPTSPNIDRLARHGARFEWAHSAGPWTLPSVTSLFLSQFPTEHGVVVDGQKISPEAVPLAARLQRLGYATAAFLRNPYAGAMSGLERGFETTVRPRKQVDGNHVGLWLDSIGDRPFFIYIHNTPPHDPFAAPSKYVSPFGTVGGKVRGQFRKLSGQYRNATKVDFDSGRPLGTTDNSDEQERLSRELESIRDQIEILYRGSVLQADEAVGSVVRELESRGLWDETLFVLISDHGEEMGERGHWQHDQSVYEELIRVPLVVRFPGDRHAETTVSSPVSLVDLLPTLAELLGRPEMADGARGTSLLPLLRDPDGHGSSRQARVTAVRRNVKKHYRPGKQARGDLNVVVRQGRWKGIWNVEVGRLELYDLASDPTERRDLSSTEPAKADELQSFAEAWLARQPLASAPSRPPNLEALDSETLERLRALGYIGSN